MKQMMMFGLSLIILSGCTTPTKYYWGGYEDNLYHFYKSPQSPSDQETYMFQLANIIENAKAKNGLVPPGIYAEYGYALLKSNKHQEAVDNFEKEGSLWPESKPLMERLIANVHVLMDKKTPVTEK